MSIGDFAPPAGLAPLLSAVGNEAFALRVPVAYGGLLVTKLQVTSCRIPDDCIDSKRYPLFMARSVLQELIKSLQSTQGVKPC